MITIIKGKNQNQRESPKIQTTIKRNKPSTGNFFKKEERREYSEEKKKDSGSRNGRKVKAGKIVPVTKLDDVNLH